VGAQVIRLLESLKTADTGLLIISHDLAVVASLADRVAVMRAGHIVEQGPMAQILEAPSHDYTKGSPGRHPVGSVQRHSPVLRASGAGRTTASQRPRAAPVAAPSLRG